MPEVSLLTRSLPHGSGLPRAIETVLAGAGLVVLGPVLIVAAIATKLSSAGPVFFRQERIGQGGRKFVLYKLRSMRVGEKGFAVTGAGDSRVTSVGRILRKSKVDELPELFNILRGDMAFVGPRPEVPRFVDLDNPLWQETLEARPGLTDPVTLVLQDEEGVLAAAGGDPVATYVERLLPVKLESYVKYLRSRTWRTDVSVIIRTIASVWIRRRAETVDLADVERRIRHVRW